jgi:hypothetical protein
MEFLPKILIISLVAGLFAQFIKIVLKSYKARKVKVSTFDDYGGMPSAHSAFLTSMLTAIAIYEGVLSTSFAIAFIIASILIRDAVGIRMELEKQGRIIKKLVNANNYEKEINAEDELADRMGHTYPEIIVGGLLGIAIAVIFFFIF